MCAWPTGCVNTHHISITRGSALIGIGPAVAATDRQVLLGADTLVVEVSGLGLDHGHDQNDDDEQLHCDWLAVQHCHVFLFSHA